jgi:superfamily II DNA or RNA helicase
VVGEEAQAMSIAELELEAPAIAARRTLDDVQDEAVSALESARARGHRSALVEMPTGTGKTVTFSKWGRREVARTGRPVLILAHTEELIGQAARKWEQWAGLPAVVEMAGDSALRSLAAIRNGLVPCVIGSVQSLQGDRLAGWPRDTFGSIVTDECHHAVCKSYRAIYDRFDFDFHAGFSATPYRADGKGLGEVYEVEAYRYHLPDAIENGHLVEPYAVQADVEVDLRELALRDGDYPEGELDRRIGAAAVDIARGIRQLREKHGFGALIAFTPRVRSAHVLAAALTAVGIASRAVDGRREHEKERPALIDQFEDRAFDGLCNAMVLIEGYDAPWVEAIVNLRPQPVKAKSSRRPMTPEQVDRERRKQGLLKQIIGRGLRTHPGKSRCYVVDFAWVTDGLELYSPVDLLASEDCDERTRRRAREIVASGGSHSIREAIQQAEQEEFDDWRKRQERSLRELRLHVPPGDVRMKVREFSLLKAKNELGLQVKETRSSRRLPATPNQIAALAAMGVVVTGSISKRAASAMMDLQFGRRTKGLSTYRQYTELHASGMPLAEAMAMSIPEASAAISAIRAGTFARPAY